MISMDIEFNTGKQEQEVVFHTDSQNEYLLEYLEKLFGEMTVELKTEWQSKYNKYVVYDYEPFCTDGFDKIYRATVSDKVLFIVALLQKYIRNVNNLETNLLLEYDKQNDKNESEVTNGNS